MTIFKGLDKSVESIQAVVSSLPSLCILDYRKFPCVPCIYFVVSSDSTIIYVGQTKDLFVRWKNHTLTQTIIKINKETKVYYVESLNPKERKRTETWLIRTIRPFFNQAYNIENSPSLCKVLDALSDLRFIRYNDNKIHLAWVVGSELTKLRFQHHEMHCKHIWISELEETRVNWKEFLNRISQLSSTSLFELQNCLGIYKNWDAIMQLGLYKAVTYDEMIDHILPLLIKDRDSVELLTEKADGTKYIKLLTTETANKETEFIDLLRTEVKNFIKEKENLETVFAKLAQYKAKYGELI